MIIYSKANENNIIGKVTIEKPDNNNECKMVGYNHLTAECNEIIANKIKMWYGLYILSSDIPNLPILYSLLLLNKNYFEGDNIHESDIISEKACPLASQLSSATPSSAHWVFDFDRNEGNGTIKSVVWRHAFSDSLFDTILLTSSDFVGAAANFLAYNYNDKICFGRQTSYYTYDLYYFDFQSNEKQLIFSESSTNTKFTDLTCKNNYIILYCLVGDPLFKDKIQIINANTFDLEKEIVIDRSQYGCIDSDGNYIFALSNIRGTQSVLRKIAINSGEIVSELNMEALVYSLAYSNGTLWGCCLYPFMGFCKIDMQTGEITPILNLFLPNVKITKYGNWLLIPDQSGFIIVFDTISEKIIKVVPIPNYNVLFNFYDGEYYWTIGVPNFSYDVALHLTKFDKPTFGVTSYYNLPTSIVKTSNDKIRVTYEFLFT